MIYVGIDDTDILGSRGTNQLARAIVHDLASDWKCHGIVRHQLLDDPRIPYTSKNGSASITLERRDSADDTSDSVRATLVAALRHTMQGWYIEGSDPGLCVTHHVPDSVIQYGRRCQQAVVTQADARQLAAEHGIHLEGLGGTEGGVIGALAAVGLIVTGDDGRIVQLGEWPDDLTGPQPVSVLHARSIDIEELDSSAAVSSGTVDVGKHLRPNRRAGKVKLYVRRLGTNSDNGHYQAIKLT
ncbi:MAG: ABC transporter substrate-binding protein [Planctomycetes bacterium]|nr:ABC transporter substrate-binding protein [Planctomycetota bacterium]